MHPAAGPPAHVMAQGMERQLVFVKVSGTTGQAPFDVFAIGAERSPQFMLDVNVHTLSVLRLKDLPKQTAWANVPTPVF